MREFKVVNTTCKGPLTALELRSQDGEITRAMRRRLRGHGHVLRVIPGNNPTKLFILTDMLEYATDSPQRAAFVNNLSMRAA